MSKELVELVVQLYEKNWGVKDYGLARAVVALCMEEAAKVADEYDGNGVYWDNASETCTEIAAEIRALIPK